MRSWRDMRRNSGRQRPPARPGCAQKTRRAADRHRVAVVSHGRGFHSRPGRSPPPTLANPCCGGCRSAGTARPRFVAGQSGFARRGRPRPRRAASAGPRAGPRPAVGEAATGRHHARAPAFSTRPPAASSLGAGSGPLPRVPVGAVRPRPSGQRERRGKGQGTHGRSARPPGSRS